MSSPLVTGETTLAGLQKLLRGAPPINWRAWHGPTLLRPGHWSVTVGGYPPQRGPTLHEALNAALVLAEVSR